MLLRALPFAVLLAVAATPLAPLLGGADARPAAFATQPSPPPPQSPATALAWPDGAPALSASCEGHCAAPLPPGPGEGRWWVTWNGSRSAPFVAGLGDAHGVAAMGVRGFDAVRLPGTEDGAHVHVWGRGSFDVLWAPDEEDLPNLVALAPAHLGHPVQDGAGGRGCLREELAAGARACLRFSSGVANSGAAALDLGPAAADPADGLEALVALVQAVGDGHVGAGPAAYHASHGHFHYDRFVAFDLHPLGPDGVRAPAVASHSKTGFCMVDWGLLDDATDPPLKSYWRRDCEPAAPTLRMGVQPGWYDLYRWFLPEQYIDMDGVPDGAYELVVTVDPAASVREANTFDNRASLLFEWRSGRATPLASQGFYRL